MQNRHAIRRLEVVYLKGNKGGYGLIYQNIMQNPDIPAYSKAIYAYLCSYADTEGVCYPSTNRIMSELGMSKNTLYKYMAYLLDFGIVKIEKTRTDKGLLIRNIYHITHNIDVSKYEIPCHEIPCHEIPCHEIPQNETQTVIDYNSNTINNNILNSTTDNTAEIYTSSTTSTLSNNIHTLSTVSINDGSCDDGSCDDGSCDRCVVKRGINNNIINSNIPNNNTLNSNTINNTDKSTLSTICTSTTTSTNTCISNIPTVDQVENECSRYGFEIEPVKFVEHCKSRNIKDWKFELYTYSAAAAGRNRNRRKEMKD